MRESSISDYALIGNSRTAALVSNTGSIDWCCMPEFDSPSIFTKLLDKENGGCFSIAPSLDFKSNQKYILDTNVVETTFQTDSGEIKLTDAFAALKEEEKKLSLYPDHEILRIVEGVKGTVRVKLTYYPKPYYGKSAPNLENRKKFGIHFSWKDNSFALLSTLNSTELYKTLDNHQKIVYEFTVNAGDRVIFSLSHSNQSPAILPELESTGLKRLENAVAYWKNWIHKCKYKGLYEEHVRRSILALKLLVYAPSGAIIAAPTTSLPEELGGIRNWDYRYCWLRDASFTVRVLVLLGFEEEAHAYMSWILHATRLTRPKLQVVYSIFGETSLTEKSLEWLSGYKDSTPVRIGNGADGQFQLDLYGEVLDAAYAYSPLVEEFDNDTQKFLIGLGEAICELWDKPDNGIWEIRSQLVHHTHSKVMAWVGLDRLMKLAEKYNWDKVPIKKYQEVSKAISSKIEKEGYNTKLNSYTRSFNGDTLDASLLTLSLVGYCKANSQRMISTCEAIYDRLSRNNFIYRYNIDDGLPGEEASFGVCTFWLVENFAKSGKLQNAISVLNKMLEVASPTGLWSEEINSDTGELLGNYPQGFTHIGLINAVLTINDMHQEGEKNL